jgi:catechol 2,3-dioxygenase-like lactoylglutathione lyase family enzyme
MDEAIARDIARHSHDGQLTRHGAPMTDHVERVAAAVPDAARAVAFLHDVLEKSDVSVDELRERGLTPVEGAALDLLTRRDGETFERHTLRIGDGEGRAGAIARSVKLADLDDHIGVARDASRQPPYRWARRHVLASQRRRHETPGTRVGSASRS